MRIAQSTTLRTAFEVDLRKFAVHPWWFERPVLFCVRALLVAAAILLNALPGVICHGAVRQESPVYIDDSPQARELFQRARERMESNAAEAARSFQELLDGYALRLISSDDDASNGAPVFTSVRSLVLDVLRDPDNLALLERYRAMEQPAAQRMLDAGELFRLVTTRSLTEAGLDAMLRLAQRDLEAGHFRSAAVMLLEATQHPDYASDSGRAAHGWFMLGVASHYCCDAGGVARAINELEMLGDSDPTMLGRLVELREAPRAVPPAEGQSPFDRGSAGDLTGLVAEEIWSVPMIDAPRARWASALTQRAPAPGFRIPAAPTQSQSSEEGRYATIMPTVVELAEPTGGQGGMSTASVVFVNQGHVITALDRFTGSRIWQRDYVDRSSLLLMDRAGEPIMDPNVIAIRGDALVTITGHAHGSSRSSDGRVICLNALNGELRWSARLDRLEIGSGRVNRTQVEGFWGVEPQGIFPYGRPLILDDLVLVSARRISPQALTSDYIVALDLETGNPRWVRHVASSGSIRRIARGFSALVAYPNITDGSGKTRDEEDAHLHGNMDPPPQDVVDVYFATAVGAVVSIEPQTGEFKWVQRFPVPLQPPLHELSRRPWELLTPHVTRERVIAIQSGRNQVAVYDRRSGELLELHDARDRAVWNAPAYLLGDEEWVYSVSAGEREIRAFRLENMSNFEWRFARQALPMRGRVQLADVGLIVPTSQGIVILDRESGEVRTHLPIEGYIDGEESGASELAGHVVAVDSQIIFASERQVSAFMSLDRAEQMLRARMTASPLNPEPAVSLARLALRARDFALVLEAGALALAAIEAQADDRHAQGQDQTPRDRLMSLLLEANADEVAQSDHEVDALFALIDRAARSPEHRFAYLLAYGDRFAQRDPARAVSAWQGILSDPALVQVRWIMNDVDRTGRAWATARIADAIGRHGAAVYELHAGAARDRLSELEAGGAPADELIALAEVFPFAEAAVEAALLASHQLVRSGEQQRALAALRRFNIGGLEQRFAPLTEQYVSLALELGMTERASAARSSQRGTDSDTDKPMTGIPTGTARVLNGRLIVPLGNIDIDLPRDRTLLQTGSVVNLLVAADGELSLKWTAELGREPAECAIVHWNDDAVLLSVMDHHDPRVLVLAASSGEHIWRTPPLVELFEQPQRDGLRSRGLPAQQTGLGTIVAAADDDVLLMAQRTGMMIAFDTQSGERLWRGGKDANADQGMGIREIKQIRLRGGLLAVAGPDVHSRPERTSILAFDARTGEQIMPHPIHVDAELNWVRLGSTGHLFYGGADGVGCIDVWRGGHCWINLTPEVVDSRRAWLSSGGDQRIFLEDKAGRIRSVDADDGTLSEPFDTPADFATGESAPQIWPPNFSNETTNLLAISPMGPDEAIAHFRDRIVRYSAAGAIIGADVIRGDRNFTWLLHGRASGVEPVFDSNADSRIDESRFIVINGLPSMPAMDPRQPGSAQFRSFRYLVHVLGGDTRLVADPVALPPLREPIQHAALIDGWLILSLSERSIALPTQ